MTLGLEGFLSDRKTQSTEIGFCKNSECCSSKDRNKTGRHRLGDDIFLNVSNKIFLSKYINKSYSSIIITHTTQLKNGQKIKSNCTREDIQIVNKHMK